MEELTGEYQVLSAVTAGQSLKLGDVVNIMVQNGGGYGDPLDRDPERVLKDVQDGAVSNYWAEKLYGVVVRDGVLIEEDTRILRTQIRNNRLSAMVSPTALSPDQGEFTSSGQELVWGDSLKVYHDHVHTSSSVSCGHCGEHLATNVEDWKKYVGVLKVGPKDLGQYLVIDERMVAEQYVCPSCGSSLWVDIVKSSNDRPLDFWFESQNAEN